jgi:hypothetical protein
MRKPLGLTERRVCSASLPAITANGHRADFQTFRRRAGIENSKNKTSNADREGRVQQSPTQRWLVEPCEVGFRRTSTARTGFACGKLSQPLPSARNLGIEIVAYPS